MATKSEKSYARTVTGFLAKIFGLQPTDGVRCFRGEANAAWPLKPSVMRNLRPEAEQSIILELMAEAPADFADDNSMFARLVRAQHYSLPTRLLDVSLNPLVGLYFACSDEPWRERDGKVVILDFPKQNIRYPDSDTISMVCNLSRLSDDERKELKDSVVKDRVAADDLKKLSSAKRLAQFVRMEKPYFQDAMRPADFRKYFFVYPSKSNKRVAAQSGAFVATGLLSYTAIHNLVSFSSSEILIPSDAKSTILKQLDILNINSRSLFPEIEVTSRYIKRKWEREPSSNFEDLLGDIFS